MCLARKGVWTALVAVVSAVGLLAGAGSALAEEAKFAFTSEEQKFEVPAGVTSVEVEAVGSEGGTATTEAAGGKGAIVRGTLPVTPGQVLYVEVGGVTFNGGGSSVFGDQGNGGGASDVRKTSIGIEPSPGGEASLNSRLLVAAGGGGGGGGQFPPEECTGGAGGNAEEGGTNGTSCVGFPGGGGGGGGEAGKGGAGGQGYFDTTAAPVLTGEAGGLGRGGAGRGSVVFGGGGGGGRFGGGGGGGQFTGSKLNGGGGGGGSNLVPEGGSHELAAVGQATSVTFTYTALPTSKEQCRKGGWKNFGTTFKNQGQCVKFVEAEKHALRLRHRHHH
jgi:hypothetical protein